ncbi:CASP-like protein 2D1 [Phragmites australis]|uniref:CASP-like protein 2D1 n=1 Tax=Phragmites australis TaxID=29695 RepID=UPI002D791E44|nr:CASP-like protein 2D1 [Phragmites australis]
MRNGRGSSESEAGKKTMAAFKLPEMALRLCVIPLTLASLWEMATNRQADDTYGEVRFSNLSGFKYLVGINAVTAAYAVASILLSSFKSLAQYDWLIFLLDQAAAYLLVTSASAAAEVLQLARRGDREVSWGEVCSYFGRFCGKATVSLALHAAALACFVALSLVSAFRVFSKCHPPGASAADCSEPEQAGEQGK